MSDIPSERENYLSRVTNAYTETLGSFKKLPQEVQQQILTGALELIRSTDQERGGSWSTVPKYESFFSNLPRPVQEQALEVARSKITGAQGIRAADARTLLRPIFNGARELLIWGVETPEELKQRKSKAKGTASGKEYHSKGYGQAGPVVKNTGLSHRQK